MHSICIRGKMHVCTMIVHFISMAFVWCVCVFSVIFFSFIMEILLEAWSRTRSNFGIHFSIANKTIFMFVKEKRNACSLWFIFVSILFAKKLCKFLLKLCAKCKSYVCIHIRIQIYNSISEIMFGY